MGDYFSDRWNALIGLPAAIADNPVFFAIVFLIAAPLIWWKWRTIGNSTQHAIDSQTHGLRTAATSKQVAHDTGIGTQDVLVMRPAKTPMGVYFAFFFFGGGALFYALVVLQSGDVSSEEWWTFAGLSAFTIISMIVMELNMTRIIVSQTKIEKRRVLHRRQIIMVSDVVAVDPLGQQISRGARIRASDGQIMKVGANFSGYKDLITRLKGGRNA